MNDYSNQYKLSGDFVKDGFMLSTNISCIGREMKGLSKAFAVVGYNKLSEQFFNLFEELSAISDSVKSLVGDRTRVDLEDAKNLSGAILKSCLAGMETAKSN